MKFMHMSLVILTNFLCFQEAVDDYARNCTNGSPRAYSDPPTTPGPTTTAVGTVNNTVAANSATNAITSYSGSTVNHVASSNMAVPSSAGLFQSSASAYQYQYPNAWNSQAFSWNATNSLTSRTPSFVIG